MTPLTARQEQIVALLLTGAQNNEIARELNMAEQTVKQHFGRMFRRYGITGDRRGKRTRLAVQIYKESKKCV
jgi:DNA-binding NarL/FixJ family response regulator